MVNENITIIIPSNRPFLANETKNCFKNYNCIIHDGSNYPSFSKLINDCIVECPTEIVIIANDKVRGNDLHVEKIVKLVNDGYGIVALYAFGFFGFKKDLIRRIGFFDERYLGGGFEDRDMIIRLNEANIAYYETREVQYLNINSSWNYTRINSLAEKHYNNKWKETLVVNPNLPQTANKLGIKRLLEEEKYNYDISDFKNSIFKGDDDCDIKNNHPFWSNLTIQKKITMNKEVNKNKKILIDQPGYLGDIIFVMAIAQKYANEGCVVDFPIFDEYLDAPIQKNFPTINIFPLSLISNYSKYHQINAVEDEIYFCLPLRASASRVSYPHMKNKYEFLGLNYNMWRNIVITRDYDRERKIFELLEINENEKYNLINENHSKNFIKTSISLNNDYKNIYMKKIDGYSIFDWIGVMEKAQSIHTVGTSIIFLMDSIQTMPKEMHIYKRHDLKDHSPYDYLLNKTYIYH